MSSLLSWGRRFFLAPALILGVASIAFVTVNVPQNAEISPYDEYVYFDYLSKVPSQLVVRSSEETGEAARNEISCRGVLNYGDFGEQCNAGTHDRDVTYPYAGQTGADIYTPLYFVTTWVAAQPLVWAGVGLLDAGRLVGGLWLAAGTILLYSLLRLMRIPKLTSLGLGLVVIATPIIFWSTTYLSTDAPTLAIAAGLGCLSILIARRQMSPAWLVIASVAAILFKLQNLAAVAVCCLGLIVHAIVQARQEAKAAKPDTPASWRKVLMRREVLWSAGAVIAALAAQLGWMVIRAALTVPGVEPPNIDTSATGLSPSSLATEAFRFLRSVGSGGLDTGVIGVLVTNVLTVLAIAALVGILWWPRRQPQSRVIIAAVTLVAVLAMGPALAIASLLAVGQYVPLPARYGLALLPALILCVAFMLDRFGSKGPRVVAGAGAVLALAAIVT